MLQTSVSLLHAFKEGFKPKRCLGAWSRIGAATRNGEITRNCLSNKQVLRLLGDDDDTDKLYWTIQAANNIATLALERAGYDANLLKATFKEKEEDNQLITAPNTIARQQALANRNGSSRDSINGWRSRRCLSGLY